MSLYGYIRVSSGAQAESGLGLAAQRVRIAEYCARELAGMTLVEIAADGGVSAHSKAFATRPEGGRISGLLAKGDHLVVAKLDRAFRSLRDAAATMEQWHRRGVVVHILDIGVATHTPIGQLLVGIMASVAQWESRRIGERIREAKAVLRAAGRCLGTVPVGWHLGDDGALAPDVAARMIVGRIVRWRRMGVTFAAIADRLNADRIPARRDRPWTHKMCWTAHRRAVAENWPEGIGDAAQYSNERAIAPGYRHATGAVKRAAREKVPAERRREIARLGAQARLANRGGV